MIVTVRVKYVLKEAREQLSSTVLFMHRTIKSQKENTTFYVINFY